MKRHLFLGFIGALALAACSDDEPVQNSDTGTDNSDAIGEVQYLAVNIVTAPSAAPVSKAEGGQEDGYPDNTPDNGTDSQDATYEEGFSTENKVTSVRFYFFDADGNALNTSGTAVESNYYDWTPTANSTNPSPNIEKQLAATIVIHKGTASDADGDEGHPHPTGELPSKMIAIINPDVASLNTRQMWSLDNLLAVERDYASTAQNNRFVMMNSVYKNGTGVVNAVPIREENYQTSADLAKNYPINIYVERNVAKVRVRINTDKNNESKLDAPIHLGGTTSGYDIYVLKDKESHPIEVTVTEKVTDNGITTDVTTEKQVYVRFYSWNVTAETNVTHLCKKIDTAWPDNLFGSSVIDGTTIAEPWNYPAYFRSYWALNPDPTTGSSFKQNWHTFNDIDTKNGKFFEGGTDKDKYSQNTIYLNENAPQIVANKQSANANVEKFTKVIIKGQLTDATGTPLEVCKYAGITLVGEDNLKKAMLTQLLQNGMIYKHTTKANGDKEVTRLDENMVIFKTALTVVAPGVDKSEKTTGRYYVFMQLKDDQKADATVTEGAESITWNTSSKIDDTNADPKLQNLKQVNQYLKDWLGSAQIYKTGQTYYFFPIRHLGAESHIGYYGVVRNHIYDCVINNIAGLGTPVYDPDETIYPEKPKEEDTFIGAQINILSWRVVSSNIELN